MTSTRPDAVVSEIEVGTGGLATGVASIDRHTGRSHEVAARSVAVWGYGIFGSTGRDRPADPSTCGPDEVPFALVAFGEMLPRAENRVTPSESTRDAWGIPALRIDCSFSDNEHAMRAHMLETLTEMLAAAGGRIVGDPHQSSAGGFVHEVGTARMGADPATSVVNGHGQC